MVFFLAVLPLDKTTNIFITYEYWSLLLYSWKLETNCVALPWHSFLQTISISVQTTGFSTCSVLIEFNSFMGRSTKSSILLHCKASDKELFSGTWFHGLLVRSTSSHWIHVRSQTRGYFYPSRREDFSHIIGIWTQMLNITTAWSIQNKDLSKLFIDPLWIFQQIYAEWAKPCLHKRVNDLWKPARFSFNTAKCILIRSEHTELQKMAMPPNIVTFISWCSLKAGWLLGCYCASQYCGGVPSRSSFQYPCP